MDERIEAVSAGKAAQARVDLVGSKERLAQMAAVQEETSLELGEWGDNIFNPLAMARKFKPLQERRRPGKAEDTEAAHKRVSSVEKAEEAADKFAKKNPELDKKQLLAVQARIKESDSADEVLEKVLDVYPDPSLADETLDYLLEIAEDGTEIKEQIILAKEKFSERFQREIVAGKNISNEARLYAENGIGSPNMLRDLYRDITGNPREPQALFEELTTAFSHSQMKDVIGFLLSSLGADMKSKGPSIMRAELERLFSETRVLQAFLGLYRFFQQRMPIIEGQFANGGLQVPGQLNYESLGKLFMRLLKEKYPSPEKVRILAQQLGISENLLAQMIVYTQYRDACRGTSPRLFHSEKHRQSMLSTLIDTISSIDDELEDEEDAHG